MGGNARSNKARNQTTGKRAGIDDAPWFKNNKERQRKRNKAAKLSRKRNRK